MKFQSTLAVASLLLGNAFAHPVIKRDDIDPTILQFALTVRRHTPISVSLSGC
jgi:hypothetical protein